ncbi:hypothetical protein IQ37_00600 [Chryseobacterium piperi]|uniref:Secretion system C-terminal sorting domain-containing protein n=1 Tax=Chryseobacterium piperi TaxID=558152 RepID=A0A086BN00_9FLAO|nr:T9SS type A sorting domain-containing protein [Chryseobacterium piperi]ASW75110.1 T9SS C-terminal target domain-containing protein [Chryseobacterium piperi]KFF30314.1 hypothetical protein IQ37_00600 [Chryseobacterium piperi]
MKSKLFFMILILFSLGVRSQNLNFPDANFKAILLSSSSSNEIAKNLNGSYFAIDANGDGEISLLEAQNVKELKIQPKYHQTGNILEVDLNENDPILNYEGINNFTNATSFSIERVNVPTQELNISGINTLKNLSIIFHSSDLHSVNINNCLNLDTLKLSSVRLTNGNILRQIKNLQLDYIQLSYEFSGDRFLLTDIENATQLENLELTSYHYSSSSPDFSLNLSNKSNLKSVLIDGIGFNDINLSSCPQLQSVSINPKFSMAYNLLQIGTLDISNCPLLSTVDFGNDYSGSGITNLIANNCISLKKINTLSKFLNTIQVNNCPVLNSIELYTASDIQMSNIPNLKKISVDLFTGNSFDASVATNLEYLKLNHSLPTQHLHQQSIGKLKNIKVKDNLALKKLSINNQPIQNLDVSGLSNLQDLQIGIYYQNPIEELNFFKDFLHYLNAENCTALTDVNIYNQVGLIDANFKNAYSLKRLSLDTSPYVSSTKLLEKLNLENCSSMEELIISNAKLNDLNIKNCTALKTLEIDNNNLDQLVFDNSPKLETVSLQSNKFSTLDFNSLTNLKTLNFKDNSNLQSLYLKNGSHELIDYYNGFSGLNNLQYVCADDFQVQELKSLANRQGISPNINSYCGENIANLSTGIDSNNSFISIDSDEDDWKGYDANGTEITPKVRATYSGWGSADIGTGVNSRWITLDKLAGNYTYKSKEFIIPDTATDAKLNLRSLSFIRNWTYLVKINPDGTEADTEITRTSWMRDGAKGWLNSRSPLVENYTLSPGKYYIKVVVFSNNNSIRNAIDVNAIVTCSEGILYPSNKIAQKKLALNTQKAIEENTSLDSNSKVNVYPNPTKETVNISSEDNIEGIEIYDSMGRLIQTQKNISTSKDLKIDIKGSNGAYILKIKTAKGIILKKIIKQ